MTPMLLPLALSGFVFHGSLQAADLITTRVAFARYDTAVTEGNPILGRSLARQLAIKGATAAGLGWLDNKLKTRKGWRKAERIVVGGLYAGLCYRALTIRVEGPPGVPARGR